MRFEASQHMKLGQQMKLAPRMIQSMEILQLPLPELTRRVLDTSQAGIDRRQVSPFAGVLAPRERWKILRQVERPDPSASC